MIDNSETYLFVTCGSGKGIHSAQLLVTEQQSYTHSDI